MKNTFKEKTYTNLKEAILGIDENTIKDIYALSFCWDQNSSELQYPKISVHYNTTANFNANKDNAEDEKEAKWDFRHWLVDEIIEIGGEDDSQLSKWFKSSEHNYSQDELEDAEMEDDDTLFNELNSKAKAFSKEFVELMVEIVAELNKEIGVATFGKEIPMTFHGFTYSADIIEWNNKINSEETIKEFTDWVATQ